jgi:hypothetical protein
MNNCQHGMRSSKDVLPGEDGALYEQRRRNAIRDLGPGNDTERVLVERHVRLEWRGQRGEAAEEAGAALKIHEVIDGAEQRAAAEVARLAANLDRCTENQRLLLRMPAGVRWMIQQWSIFGDRLVTYVSLLGTQRKRALALLGKSRQDALRDDPVALRWLRALLGATLGSAATPQQIAGELGGLSKSKMSRAEFDFRVEQMAGSLPDKAEGHALLVTYVAEEIRRLEELLMVIEPLAERNLALEAQEARADKTAEGVRLGQQILASYRGSDAALRRLETLQNPRRPGPGRGVEEGRGGGAGCHAGPGGPRSRCRCRRQPAGAEPGIGAACG